MMWLRDRRALFTDFGSGNTSATSESRTTMTVSLPKRLADLPRINGPKSDLLYSLRSSSGPLLLAFFIYLPFRPADVPCADHADGIRPLSMRHHEELAGRRHTKS